MSISISDLVKLWRQEAAKSREQADCPENMAIADALLARQGALLQCADQLVYTAKQIIKENSKLSRKALLHPTKSYAPKVPSKPVRGPDGRFVKAKK